MLDHVLTNSTDRISQSGEVDTGLSDHQLIYCTRKVNQSKFNTHKYIRTRSLKNYSQSSYLEKLNAINFPNYSKFKDIYDAYSEFIGKVTSVIDQIAPMKEIRAKNYSQDWFDAEIHEEIETRDKLLAKFKKSRKSTDHEHYKKARNKVQYLISDEKKTFVVGKLNENIGKPKELWKSLKSLGLPSKTFHRQRFVLKKTEHYHLIPKLMPNFLEIFYSNLASGLLKKLPSPQINSGKKQLKNTTMPDGKSFSFRLTTLKLLEEVNPSKSAGIDNLAGKKVHPR